MKFVYALLCLACLSFGAYADDPAYFPDGKWVVPHAPERIAAPKESKAIKHWTNGEWEFTLEDLGAGCPCSKNCKCGKVCSCHVNDSPDTPPCAPGKPCGSCKCATSDCPKCDAAKKPEAKCPNCQVKPDGCPCAKPGCSPCKKLVVIRWHSRVWFRCGKCR